ncbi:MAG: hypothetical protein ACP5UV_03565 [Thermoplasmata archaeon]
MVDELERSISSGIIMTVLILLIALILLGIYTFVISNANTGYCGTSTITDSFLNVKSGDAGFVVSIFAIFFGYCLLGKDSIDNTIESTLARPLTKAELVSSRYAAPVIIFGVLAFARSVIWITMPYILGIFICRRRR